MVLKVLLADIVVLIVVLLILLFVCGKSWLMTDRMFNYIIEGHTVHDVGHEQGARGYRGYKLRNGRTVMTLKPNSIDLKFRSLHD